MRDTIDGINEKAWDRAMSRTPEQAAFRSFKSKLTRRVNRKDWHSVIALWHEFKAFYDNNDQPWPDDWRRWERAAEDARYTLQRENPGKDWLRS